MTTRTRTSPAGAYHDELRPELDRLLGRIAGGLDRHHDACNGRVTWGHVGDLESIRATLADIEDRLWQTGEYARSAGGA